MDAPDHKKRVELEATREHKWIRMLKEWEKLFPTKLPQRIWVTFDICPSFSLDPHFRKEFPINSDSLYAFLLSVQIFKDF